MNTKKMLTPKIFMSILIAVAIGTIWFFKTSKSDSVETSLAQQSVEASSSQNSQNEAVLPERLKDADFSLAVTKEVDFAAFAKYELPLIVDYGSDSCVTCKQMYPVLKKLNEEMVGKAFIKFADVWKYQGAAKNAPIELIPSQVFFNSDGKPFVPSDALSQKIKFVMHKDKTSGVHNFTVHQGGLTEEQTRLILKEMGVKE